MQECTCLGTHACEHRYPWRLNIHLHRKRIVADGPASIEGNVVEALALKKDSYSAVDNTDMMLDH